MNRKQFLKKTAFGLGTAASLPFITAISECAPVQKPADARAGTDCDRSPEETDGPFPNHDSASLVKTDIRADRQGVALAITLTVVSQKDGCKPMPGVMVDIWHCDAQGAYSEYGGMRMQQADHTREHFCRGRQTTDPNGQVTFQSIYPGWYRGRAPHIHLEVLDKNGRSLLISQIAFPEDVNSAVYATAGYRGKADTSNDEDGIFRDSLRANLADQLSGDAVSGLVLVKTIVV